VGSSETPAGHDIGLTIDGVSQLEQIAVPVPLAPGETWSASFDTIITLSGGSDSVTVCADTNNEVVEGNEGNNCLTGAWPSLPDLTVIGKSEQWLDGQEGVVLAISEMGHLLNRTLWA